MRKLLPFFVLICCLNALHAQQTPSLTVEKIMRDPKWMGTSPENLSWGEFDGQLYFRWNPDGLEYAPLYSITPNQSIPQRKSEEVLQQSVSQVQYSPDGKLAVYLKGGDLFLRNLKSKQEKQLTATEESEADPQFTSDGQSIFFRRRESFYALSLADDSLKQFAYFLQKEQPNAKQMASTQDKWLNDEQLSLFDVLNDRKRRREVSDSLEKQQHPKGLKPLELAPGEFPRTISVSPSLQYVSYVTFHAPKGTHNTAVPNYVTESGYTEDISGRTKVGNPQGKTAAFLYDRQKDTVFAIQTASLEGIRDIPAFYNDYPEKKDSLQKLNADRPVTVNGFYWNPTGDQALVVLSALDHKDRWIARLNLQTGKLETLDRQHDDAWIAGPGIGGGYSGGNIGWIDNQRFYYQSEASGYSHVYTMDIQTKEKKQLTSGNFEVQELNLSKDKKTFYLVANKEHPGITHFYSLPVDGGKLTQITSMKGGNEVFLSPDEKWLAIRYSYSNKPWELYLQENKPGAKALQITESTSEEFKAYPWRAPEVISFANRAGDSVHARLYLPEKPKSSHPAVVFVHGAGYLQNVHYWWSSYFREYLFNNLLTDLGYTVLDIDYTGSSGYGRDVRTGIYRHMGGKDLTDQVDGVQVLVEKYGVNPKNVGIYGGSYGGFMTLMALFTEPDVFTAGAGLRSVTDWAHYNHGYTSNILNEPHNDPKAYQQSSPINFASGLKGYLLMCHGMVDVNVHFQDIVRLNQRLIELGKKNWNLAVYPVEDHGFIEASSWTDEYNRILQLFEERLTN